MKTSNRILLGFFTLVFATPIFLFMGFRNKINKGEFTVTRTLENNQKLYTGVIKPYKVVKVTGPEIPEVFFCNIIPAALASLKYNNYGQYDSMDSNSINLQQKGDTLLVKYVNAGRQGNGNITYQNYQEYMHVNITLYLPVIQNIIVEGANVSIDSVSTAATAEIQIDLSKRAQLTLGRSGTTTTVNLTENHVHDRTDTITNHSFVNEKSTGQFNKLNIRGSNSQVSFGMHAWVKDLNLNMLGSSTVTVDDKSRIDQLTGFISDTASVKANWKNIRRLATLTGK